MPCSIQAPHSLTNRPFWAITAADRLSSWSVSASTYLELSRVNFLENLKLSLYLEAVIKRYYNMESTIIRDDEAQSKGRIKLLADINEENSLCLAVKDGQLSSFSSLLRQGIPMTSRVISLMFESWTNQGSEFCEAWLCEGGKLNDFYDDSTPLK